MNRTQQSLMTGIVMAVTAWGAAWGQVVSPQFNLITPGARSLGMGGAFLALADDATAAYTNPAGLTNLIVGGPQVAVELRNWGYSTPYIAEGRLDGTPNQFGLDFGEGLLADEAETEISDLAFASFGYVLPRGITFALYKNQLANFSTEFQNEGWFFDPRLNRPSGACTVVGENPTCRTWPTQFATSLKVDSLGAAMAYEIRKPFNSKVERPLSVGVGLARYQLKSETGVLAFRFNYRLDPAAVDAPFGRSQFLPANIVDGLLEIGDDSALGMIYGFLWKLRSQGGWSVGGVYRQGPEFSTKRLNLLTEAPLPGTLKVPDVYGVGISYSPPRSEGRTKVALDYQKILYSQRLGDFFNGAPNPDFNIKDADEIHLGVERVVVTSGKFVGTVRAGGWRESAHTLEYRGSDVGSQLLYPEGQADTHWSLGLGLVIGEQYQLDSAVDLSDRVNTFSFSIVRFF